MADRSDSARLLDLAIEIAVYAPKKQGKYVHAAGISWKLIHELRDALDAVGVDWREAKKEDDARKARVREYRREQTAARMMSGPSHPPIEADDE
jgi:hypothetical protein